MLRLRLALFLLVSLAACGSDEAATSTSTSTTSTSTTATTIGTSAPTTSAASSTTVPPTSSATSAPVDRRCRPVADLEDEDELRRWQVVNDGVMGGRSSAEATVVDSVLTIAGEIVTDGGGFSSVRLALDEPLGDEATALLLRVRTDGRPYELTVADTAAGRDPRVSHQGPIPASGGDWEEVEVDLTDLDASIFGRPVEVDPFEPGAAVEVGIILADGSDGPFRLELDWIRACP